MDSRYSGYIDIYRLEKKSTFMRGNLMLSRCIRTTGERGSETELIIIIVAERRNTAYGGFAAEPIQHSSSVPNLVPKDTDCCTGDSLAIRR